MHSNTPEFNKDVKGDDLDDNQSELLKQLNDTQALALM